MLNQLRKHFILFLIKRNQKKKAGGNKKVSLQEAKNVGIITMIDSKDMLDQVVKMKKTIESYGSHVEAIAYVPAKTLPRYFDDQMQLKAFSKKQVNVAGIPKGMAARDFLAKRYDVMIDLTLTAYPPLRYLAGIANAGIKAGGFDESMVDVYDVMIKHEEGCEFGDFLFAMKNYLSRINTLQI